MKQRLSISLMLLVFISLIQSVKAQSNDPVMLKVADESITRGEFLKVYQKNNPKGEAMDRQSLEEYLDLYINFRLKVREAKTLGMDTIKTFIDELSSYRKQLTQPYLTNNKATDALIQEAFTRKLSDVRGSHILVKVDRFASAADTLAAWNKIMQIRKRVLKGEDFGKLASTESDDPSAHSRTAEGKTIPGNQGDLGYFTAFDMVYGFENAAYNMKVGDISMPIRTDFGYHLIKLTDKLPAMGKVQIAHIILIFPKNGTLDDSLKVADSANLAYTMLRNGNDFGAVAKKFSDDKSSSDKGGVLPWFGVNRMLPEFIQTINKLKKTGDYSEPFQTSFGWHIVKLNDRKPIGSFDDEKEEIRQKITKNDRVNISKESFLNLTKGEYGFREDPSSLQEFNSIVTDSIFNASWKVQQADALTKPMFTIGTRTYTQPEFAKYLAAAQRKGAKKDIPAFLNSQYKEFVDDAVMKYADSQLENKYPDFKALMTEYHDGILLFDLTDKKVWTKAVKDTVGLQQFYVKNRNNYMWEQRLDASIITINDPGVVKGLKKMVKKGLSDAQILAAINQDTIQKISIEHKKFLRGENMVVDSLEWKAGTYGPFMTKAGKNTLVVIHRLVQPEPKELHEARGIITADYQNFLEKEWIAELRAKYEVEVKKDIFSSLFEKQ